MNRVEEVKPFNQSLGSTHILFEFGAR